MRTCTSKESGNVLFFILIAVGLLAALSFVVAQGNRGGADVLGAERARLLAGEIIEFSTAVGHATSQVRLRGYLADEVSFEAPGAALYANTNCSSDDCKVFHISGGGVNFSQPPTEAMAVTPVPDNQWHIYGDNEILNVGSTCGTSECSDVILVVDELRKEVCQQINDLLDIAHPMSEPPTDGNLGEAAFTGTFGFTNVIGDTDSQLAGRKAGCFLKSTSPTEYVFYQVLIER